ncbi:hypothetical protein ORV05_07275 [Amycolatopsis cynarae]|uniref:Tetracyclin repressor SlmA-like C-terminal domain-containing protein n=1 Tax=Amycolatopsis cynarae TaxID=2995223 RepID=A0ABY7B5J7_9PSEU|nr:hypothetical protein [Amycolatopsis sp. HUAS 11-8]WAL67575.1 hypothetical protein ORV05_07275 [Amycolatopsis sp. HUAS 11-8]
MDRYWEQVADRVVASLGDRLGEIGPARIRDVVDALVAALEADRALLRVIHEELPPRRLRHQRRALEQRVRELATAAMAVQVPEHERPGVAVKAWVVVLAIENLTMRWVLDEPDLERDRLLDEVTAMIAGYLPVSAV